MHPSSPRPLVPLSDEHKRLKETGQMDRAIERLKEVMQREDRKVMEFLKLLYPSLSEDEIVELVARETRYEAERRLSHGR